MKITYKSISIFVLIFFMNCASESMEFTTAKTALRSEKDFKRAEDWLQKALKVDSTDAMICYVYATEILKPQKRFQEMSKMLDLALKRNPDQKLETPFMWEDKAVMTVKDGVKAYKEQEWSIIYNEGIDNYQKNNLDKAIELFETAILFLPTNPSTYGTLAALYLSNNKTVLAGEIIEKGLSYDNDNENLIEMQANYYIQNNDLINGEKSLIKALGISKNPGNILRQLVFVQIDLEKYESAIEYSLQALRDFPNDPDIYYNVAVLYQKMGIDKFDKARGKYLKISNEQNQDKNQLEMILEEFKDSRNLFVDSKDYFLTVTDLNPDDDTSYDAVKEIKKMLKQLDELFIPSLRDMIK
tara:strand:+ start:3161 stop:4228 length:1068 start_codon:yes stop_codon:yes gene_type:complete